MNAVAVKAPASSAFHSPPPNSNTLRNFCGTSKLLRSKHEVMQALQPVQMSVLTKNPYCSMIYPPL